jgi:hypothetical protein
MLYFMMRTDFSQPILRGCKTRFGRNRFASREIGSNQLTVRIHSGDAGRLRSLRLKVCSASAIAILNLAWRIGGNLGLVDLSKLSRR